MISDRIRVNKHINPLSELRRVLGKTQEEVATAVGRKQSVISRFERQDNIQLSTFVNLVEAMGGTVWVHY